MNKRIAILILSILAVIVVVVAGSLGFSVILHTFLAGPTFDIANLTVSILWGGIIGNVFAHKFLIKQGYLN